MKHSILGVTIVSLGITLGTTGCSDFLTGNVLVNNPNNPSTALCTELHVRPGRGIRLAGEYAPAHDLHVDAAVHRHRGPLRRAVRAIHVTDASWSFDFSSVYTGGGLVDIRRVEDGARAANDKTWLGVGQVYEAFLIGSAADLWGNIPIGRRPGTWPRRRSTHSSRCMATSRCCSTARS